MKQFNLNEWLVSKSSRKVVTRDGRNVRIVCWDAPEHIPYIYGFIEGDNGITNWHKDGMWANKESICDLFFTDDEDEKLTEFEEEIAKIIGYDPNIMCDRAIEHIKYKTKRILDLVTDNINTKMRNLSKDYDFSLKGLGRELDEFFINRLNAYLRGASKEELDNQIYMGSSQQDLGTR